MSLRDRFTESMKEAMKAKQQQRLTTVRMMMAKLKDLDIEARTTEKGKADESDILSMLSKMVKQRQDSITMYEQGGRQDLADNEKAEIAIIEEFLPQQLTTEQVNTAIQQAIAETGASSMKDMGKIMTYLKDRYTGQMDFAKANGQIKTALAS